jgi:hypothetical protein
MHRLAILLLVLTVCLSACGSPAPPDTDQPIPAWPAVEPVASYDIQVTLDVDAKTVSGHETITYVNTTKTSIPDLVFHLYLNAFRDSTSSIFMQESGPSHAGFSFDPDYPGKIEVTKISLADGHALKLELIEDETLARAALPAPIAPGEMLRLEIDFTSTLPLVFTRTGFYDDFFMVGQWFPKLGVWQDKGWNAYPFHANSEFFADFGNYDVAITLPGNYVTGGTGLPVSAGDNGDGTQTVRYHAEAVIDFAWTASPNFGQASRNVDGVEVTYLYLPEHAFTADRALDAAESAVTSFGAWFGAYPYPRLTVVDVPDQAGAGGMEYPMLVTAGLEDITGLNLMKGQFDRMLEIVTVHEIGHEWWYAVVAFNEAEEPWLDEGFTDYSTMRLMEKAYGPYDVIEMGSFKMSYMDMRRMEYLMMPATPMAGKAWDFDSMEAYGVAAYSKPAVVLTTLERVLGEEQMLKIMSTFFERYRFKHPTTEDFRATVKEVSGQDVTWFFDGLVYSGDVLNYSVSAVEGQRVSVTRQGDLIIPTEVQVTFADGSGALEAWDGKETQKTFDYPGRPTIESAQIDPNHKLLVDLQWSDNGLSRRMDVWSWLALNTRFLYQLQNMLLGQGGL